MVLSSLLYTPYFLTLVMKLGSVYRFSYPHLLFLWVRY
jgi:hypothetical protein